MASSMKTADAYKGLDRYDARKKIVEELQVLGIS